jgi:LmbE family N-acetylglucosaminyl deacetylase
MIGLGPGRGPLHVVCLGAHPDDIEIGCGATLLTLARRPETTVTGIVVTGEGSRAAEARDALPAFVPQATVHTHDLPDGRLPAHWLEVKELLEAHARELRPDVVLAPRVDDAHQDHRLVGSLASTVWRDVLILHYEIPKWDGDLGAPSVYVGVDAETAATKWRLLDKVYASQRGRDWWDEEMFLGLMRVRGMECRSAYAEAFYTTKMSLRLDGTLSGEVGSR